MGEAYLKRLTVSGKELFKGRDEYSLQVGSERGPGN